MIGEPSAPEVPPPAREEIMFSSLPLQGESTPVSKLKLSAAKLLPSLLPRQTLQVPTSMRLSAAGSMRYGVTKAPASPPNVELLTAIAKSCAKQAMPRSQLWTLTPEFAVNHRAGWLRLIAVRPPLPPFTAIQVVPLPPEWLRSVAAEPLFAAPARIVPASEGCCDREMREVSEPSVLFRLSNALGD